MRVRVGERERLGKKERHKEREGDGVSRKSDEGSRGGGEG